MIQPFFVLSVAGYEVRKHEALHPRPTCHLPDVGGERMVLRDAEAGEDRLMYEDVSAPGKFDQVVAGLRVARDDHRVCPGVEAVSEGLIDRGVVYAEGRGPPCGAVDNIAVLDLDDRRRHVLRVEPVGDSDAQVVVVRREDAVDVLEGARWPDYVRGSIRPALSPGAHEQEAEVYVVVDVVVGDKDVRDLPQPDPDLRELVSSPVAAVDNYDLLTGAKDRRRTETVGKHDRRPRPGQPNL